MPGRSVLTRIVCTVCLETVKKILVCGCSPTELREVSLVCNRCSGKPPLSHRSRGGKLAQTLAQTLARSGVNLCV